MVCLPEMQQTPRRSREYPGDPKQLVAWSHTSQQSQTICYLSQFSYICHCWATTSLRIQTAEMSSF